MTAPEQWDGTAFDAWGAELVDQVHEEGARLDARYEKALEDVGRACTRARKTLWKAHLGRMSRDADPEPSSHD